MFGVGMQASGDRYRDLVDAERHAADRTERISDRAMDRMSDVAAGRGPQAGDKPDSKGQQAKKVILCPNCKPEVDTGKNHCGNCGTKMY